MSASPHRRSPITGAKIRLLQVLALYAPGAETLRPRLHRARGVRIGRDVFIGADTLLDTWNPGLISIGDGVTLSARVTIIAHFRGLTSAERGGGSPDYSVRIEDEVFIGPSVTILPGVTIGRGAVVTAGSVVNSGVAPMTMVQGNPARPIARCGIPLGPRTEPGAFYRHVTPLRPRPPTQPAHDQTQDAAAQTERPSQSSQ